MPNSQDMSSKTTDNKETETADTALFNDTFLSDKSHPLQAWNLPVSHQHSNSSTKNRSINAMDSLRGTSTSFSHEETVGLSNNIKDRQPSLQNLPPSSSSSPNMMSNTSNRRPPDTLHTSTLAYEIEMDQLYGFLIPSDENPLL